MLLAYYYNLSLLGELLRFWHLRQNLYNRVQDISWGLTKHLRKSKLFFGREDGQTTNILALGKTTEEPLINLEGICLQLI